MRNAFLLILLVFAWGGAASAAHDAVPQQTVDVVYDAERRELAGTLVTTLPGTRGPHYFLLLPNFDREKNPHLAARAIDERYPFGFAESALDVERVALMDGETRTPISFRLLAMPPAWQTYSLADTVLAIDDVQTASAVEIAFATRAPRTSGGDNGVSDGTFTWRFGWYPLWLEPNAAFDERDGVLTAGDTDAFPLSFPLVDVTARVTLPADVTLTAGVDRIEREATPAADGEPDEGFVTYALHNDAPARTLALTFGPDLERYTLDGDLPIEVTYAKGHVYEARLLATYARDMLADYSARYGPYSRPVFRIVESPSRGGDALSADGIALLSTRFFTHRDVLLPAVLHRLTEFVLAHEIAHQWFGMRTGLDLDRDAWLSEGLTQHASVGYFERVYGAKDPNLLFVEGRGLVEEFVANQFGYLNLREHMVELSYLRNVWDGFDEALVTPQSEVKYANASAVRLYEKGYMVARALAASVGEEAFDGILRDLLADRAAGSLDSPALEAAVEAATGRSYDAWFAAWVYGEASVDYSVKILSRVQTGSTYETRVRVRRDGGVPQDVVVEARLVSEATTRQTWDGMEDEAEVVFRTPSPVARVTIDPEHRLPDRDRINNHAPVRILVAADKAVLPLDAYVIAPDTGSSGVSLSRLDRFRVGVSQDRASLTLRPSRSETIEAAVALVQGDLEGSAGYAFTRYAPVETGASGTTWAPHASTSLSGHRLVTSDGPIYVARAATLSLPTPGDATIAAVGFDLISTGAARLAATASEEFGLFPRVYVQATGFVGYGLGALPPRLQFGYGELHAAALPLADVKLSGSLALELPSFGELPYNLANLAMIDDVRLQLYIAGGAGWTRRDGFGTTSAGFEVGMEQVFDLSTLGGFLPLQVRLGVAVALQGKLAPVVYAGFSL